LHVRGWQFPFAIEWLIDYPILLLDDDHYLCALVQSRRQEDAESSVRISVRRLAFNPHLRVRHRFARVSNQSSTKLDLLTRRYGAENSDGK
jgi:hypothetical protein